MKHVIFSCMLLLLTASVLGQGKQLRADKTKSYIKYYMKHALHSWSGISKDVNCLVQLNAGDEIEKVAATVKVSSFDSDNSNRDSHMLEVTDALKFPSITFVSTSIVRTSQGYSVKGNLSFHGVEKPVELQMIETKEGLQRRLTGSFIFLLEDYKIERPSLMMMRTDNEVKTELSFLL
jgi:polyisoprenoid-binding protein YceI